MIGLLDTHTFIWAVTAPDKLSAAVRVIITDPSNEIHLSTVSLWEISLKHAVKKLEILGCEPEDLVPVAREMGIQISEPTPEEYATFHKLPKTDHKEPFDRLLIWQCLTRKWTLISRDTGLEKYKTAGLRIAWE